MFYPPANIMGSIVRSSIAGFWWVVWLAVHLFWLIGIRNRLLVLINWMWDYFLYERGVRVITRNGRQRLGSS